MPSTRKGVASGDQPSSTDLRSRNRASSGESPSLRSYSRFSHRGNVIQDIGGNVLIVAGHADLRPAHDIHDGAHRCV